MVVILRSSDDITTRKLLNDFVRQLAKNPLARKIVAEPPADPPPNVPALKEAEKGLTLRQRLEAHREKPVCANCHALMDPIGLGLEGFDAIGRARTLDEGLPIDTSGRLPSGQTFRDAVELAQILALPDTLQPADDNSATT